MKLLLISAFVAAGLFHSAAFADDMDFGNLEAEQLKKDGATLEEGKPTSVAPEVEATTTDASTNTSPEAVAKTGAKKRGTSWKEIRRNFGAGFFQWANAAADEWNRSRGNITSYNYMSLEYRTGRGEKVFVRPAFLAQTSGQDLRGNNLPGTFAWHDVYLGYSSYNIPWMPFEMDYKSEVRVYLPTGTTSQNEGMIARIRGDLKAHYPLTNRLTFLLWFKPDYYIQSRTAYQNGRYVNGTRDYGYELSANLFYQLRGGVWGFGGAVQHEQSWAHASVVEQINVFRREEVSAQIFVGFNAFGLLSHIGINQAHDVARPRNGIVAFNDTETEYFARTYYRF